MDKEEANIIKEEYIVAVMPNHVNKNGKEITGIGKEYKDHIINQQSIRIILGPHRGNDTIPGKSQQSQTLGFAFRYPSHAKLLGSFFAHKMNFNSYLMKWQITFKRQERRSTSSKWETCNCCA